MFTNNWFDQTAIFNFEKYILPLKAEERPQYFLEIGCYEGRASVWLMENSNARLTVIDTFKGSKEHSNEDDLFDRFQENIKPYKNRIIIEPGTSREKLKGLGAREFYDFIYVDGSHQASDVLEDIILAFPLLKQGGIMILDDYTWGQGMDYYDVPSSGINAFLTVYGNQIEILEKNSQVILTKPKQIPLPKDN